MPTATAYTTDNPNAVEAYLAAQTAESAFALTVIADAEKLGHTGRVARHLSKFTGAYTTVGLAVDDPTATPPAGWKYSKRTQCLIPRTDSLIGGQATQWLKDHQPPDDANVHAAMQQFGLPLNDLAPNGGAGLPLLGRSGDALWALYEGTPGHWTHVGCPPITWQQCTVDEFRDAQARRRLEQADARTAAVQPTG